MRDCYISAAGNIRPEENILEALLQLQELFPIRAISGFYRTAAIGRPEQPDYLNGVVSILYDGDPKRLKFEMLRPIEAALGRQRSGDSYAARPVDLDILLCGDLVMDDPELQLPDPDILQRPFLAAGLLELNADLVIPGTALTLKTLITKEQLESLERDTPFTKTLHERLSI